jgi:hypothetical protein
MFIFMLNFDVIFQKYNIIHFTLKVVEMARPYASDYKRQGSLMATLLRCSLKI